MSPSHAGGRRYIVVGVIWLLTALALGTSGNVAAAHLGLDVVSLPFEEGFDRRVKIGLGG